MNYGVAACTRVMQYDTRVFLGVTCIRVMHEVFGFFCKESLQVCYLAYVQSVFKGVCPDSERLYSAHRIFIFGTDEEVVRHSSDTLVHVGKWFSCVLLAVKALPLPFAPLISLLPRLNRISKN